ncbi:hypothetical protein [Aquisediminimonas sediminicola]|uniref:hypothetical protein n=1 Tax=Alteraquisediminimonas sediminicola TaxID=2676787 RepID=UPI001C8E45C4|nr:hypothetical protein [Aquisediminimonas sediminicola]
MFRHKRLLIVPALLLLSACGLPEQKVRTGLINAGLRPPMAGCMAKRMVERLSISQLQRLGALGNLKDKDWRELPMDQFLHNVRALKDPEILSVTSASALLCAVNG